jgi:hypothetical protein
MAKLIGVENFPPWGTYRLRYGSRYVRSGYSFEEKLCDRGIVNVWIIFTGQSWLG